MNAVLRILGVAACEVAEAFRSRRFILVLLLFFSASAVSMYGSTAFLGHLEKNAAKMLGLPEGDGKGAVTRVVWKSIPTSTPGLWGAIPSPCSTPSSRSSRSPCSRSSRGRTGSPTT